jgi:hypothetical protein
MGKGRQLGASTPANHSRPDPHEDGVCVLLVQHLAEQAGVSCVVLNPQQTSDRLPAQALCCCGSLTLVSQKSLMLVTRPSNASSWTGFLR